MQIKKSLNEAIIESGMKKQYLAEQLKVPAPTISLWLKKPYKMKVDKAIKICSIIGCDLDNIDFSIGFDREKK